MEVVGGSIPLATTSPPTRRAGLILRSGLQQNRTLRVSPFPPESRMLKFLGSTVGIIFLIGLIVTIVLLKAIF
jgi:hypothetical protein